MNFLTIVLAFSLLWGGNASVKPEKIKAVSKHKINIPEPSDIVYDRSRSLFYVVSDKGYLYTLSEDYKQAKRVAEEGIDLEGVCLFNNNLLVLDETTRRVFEFEKENFTLKRTRTYPYNGARNKGYESIACNPENNSLILITEKDPLILLELDNNWNIVNERRLPRPMKEIAAAMFHNNQWWLLSDEDSCIYILEKENFTLTRILTFDIHNPEGIAIGPKGNLLILSDDLQTIYDFGGIQ
jgi:uncharacterized protein YjiK